MKKLIIVAMAMAFCAGCHIPYPSSGRRTLQPYERYEEVCVTKANEKGEKTTRCKWVRSR